MRFTRIPLIATLMAVALSLLIVLPALAQNDTRGFRDVAHLSVDVLKGTATTPNTTTDPVVVDGNQAESSFNGNLYVSNNAKAHHRVYVAADRRGPHGRRDRRPEAVARARTAIIVRHRHQHHQRYARQRLVRRRDRQRTSPTARRSPCPCARWTARTPEPGRHRAHHRQPSPTTPSPPTSRSSSPATRRSTRPATTPPPRTRDSEARPDSRPGTATCSRSRLADWAASSASPSTPRAPSSPRSPPTTRSTAAPRA